MSELKKCPFCGAEVQDDERGEKYPRKSPMGGWIIHCECCGASLSQFRKSGKGEISWNTRPIEDALNARIAKLVNLVEVQHDDNCHLADMCRQRDASIAELEATIDQLIKAGKALTSVAEWRYANLTELLAWDTLVEKIRKEREK